MPNPNYPPNGPGPNPNIPPSPGNPTSPSNPAIPSNVQPQYITSTGGLYGLYGAMMAPYLNTTNGYPYVIIYDPSNFNCEEAGEYDFRQEIPVVNQMPQEGRNVSCHLIILKYRELGVATFSVNVTVYNRLTDTFSTRSIIVNIQFVKGRTFPDKRIHTRYIGLKPLITGERPQVTLTFNANSGPWSVTSLTLCGNADELPQL